jgi:hypothetical protein
MAVFSRIMRRVLDKILLVLRLRKPFAGSGAYWESRYRSGGHSGGGSYGKLALYKADFLNNFIAENDIQTCVEWGCGDGHQTSLLVCKHYLGLDVSPTAVSWCKKKFENDPTKSFASTEEFRFDQPKDLALSLDVIYHLVEDIVFTSYMDNLFRSATRFVIIYSCNFESEATANHVKPRKFSTFIEEHFPEWKMTYMEENPYPMISMNNPETSWSNFFVYARKV